MKKTIGTADLTRCGLIPRLKDDPLAKNGGMSGKILDRRK